MEDLLPISTLILVTAGLILTGDLCLSAGPCHQDADCPKPHMACSRLNSSQEGGVCGCLPGWVAWKWDCHPAGHLGDPCVTSLQCQVKEKNSICNPINQRCSCERGHTPVRAPPSNSGIPPPHQAPTIPLVCRPDKIEKETEVIPIYSEDKELARPRHPPRLNAEDQQGVLQQAMGGTGTSASNHQTNSAAIFLAIVVLLGGVVAITATALYLKTLQEKKMSQAAVRSLLNLISDNEAGLKPSFTSDSLKTHSTEVDGYSRHYSNSNPEGSDWSQAPSLDLTVSSRGSDTSLPAIGGAEASTMGGESNAEEENHGDRPIIEPVPDLSNSLPSKLILTPLEEGQQLRFPAPHLSHPTLPPIRGPPKSTRPPRGLGQTQPAVAASSAESQPKPTTASTNGGQTIPAAAMCSSAVPMQTLSLRNLPLYRLTADPADRQPCSAASFPDEIPPPRYDDLLLP